MSLTLTLGFALLIVMMAGLVGHGVWQIRSLQERLRDIVEVRNHKIQLATDLQEASYNRHNALVYQTLSRDPFERDDNFQQYIKWGYLVGKARNELKAMPLEDFERRNLAEQDSLVARIIGIQEQISDLAARDQLDTARNLLSTELRPLNLRYTQTVEQLRRYERDLIQAGLQQTRQASRQAITLHLVLGGTLILLALAISILTHLALKRHAVIIDDQMQALEQAGARLRHKATHDPLTGLANRALFHQRLAEALVHAGQDQLNLAVLYVDLDDFKQVNDVHGHGAGDALLQTVALRLRNAVRKTDTVARLGGDEFAVLILGLDLAEPFGTLCLKISQAVAQPLQLGATEFTPSCSIGHAIYPDDGGSVDTLLQAADRDMYRVKWARKTDSAAPCGCPPGAQA
jgi:diguanylate cyclase (GGDEF)-like protein